MDELTGLEKTNIQKGRDIQEYYKSRVSQDGPHFRIRSKNPMQDFEYGIEKYSDEQLGVPEEPFTCTDFRLEDTTIRFIHPDSYRLCPQCTYHNHYTSSQCTMCSSLLTKSCTRREWECSICKLINIPAAKVWRLRRDKSRNRVRMERISLSMLMWNDIPWGSMYSPQRYNMCPQWPSQCKMSTTKRTSSSAISGALSVRV